MPEITVAKLGFQDPQILYRLVLHGVVHRGQALVVGDDGPEVPVWTVPSNSRRRAGLASTISLSGLLLGTPSH